MTDPHSPSSTPPEIRPSSSESSWAFVGISPEARKAAELAAEEADMDVDLWLAQLIKYRSAMELRGKETGSLDAVIMQIASPSEAEATQPPAAAPSTDQSASVAAEAVPASPVSEDDPGAPETLRVGNVTPLSTSASVPRPVQPSAPPAAESEAPSGVTPSSTAPQSPAGETTATEEEHFPGVDPMPAPGPGHDSTDSAALPKAGTVDDVAVAVLRPGTNTAAPSVRREPAPAAAKTGGGIDVGAARMMPTEALRPTRLSALSRASEEEIQSALDSWRDSRAVEPLVVRPAPEQRNMYEIIVGVARWHAARRAHVRELPITIREVSDEEAIRIAMSARLNRGGASPLMEAEIYMSLMSEAQMSTEQVARMVGKPPAHIATVVRVLNLPKSVRDMLDRGEITALHARALLDAHNPDAIAKEIIARRLDIYQTEQLVRTAAQQAGDVEKVSLEAVDLDMAETLSDIDTAADREDRKRDGEEGVASATTPPATASDEPAFPARDIGRLSQKVMDVSDDAIGFEDDDIVVVEDAATPKDETSDGPSPANDVSKSGKKVEENPAAEVVTMSSEAVAAADEADAGPPSEGGEVVTTELLERHLARLLGIKVAITESENVGVMTLHYAGREQLSDIVARLNSSPKR